MALKSLFFAKIYKNRPAAGGSASRPPSVIRLSCISFFSTAPKLNNFRAKKSKKNNFCFKPSLSLQNRAFTAAARFFKRLNGPQMKHTKKYCRSYVFFSDMTAAGLMSFFSDMNTKFFK